MLTPVFELSQDDEFVVVIIKTPYVKPADVDFCINDTEFKFYVKPYFLRLNLPGEIVEDGRESASYDVDKGKEMKSGCNSTCTVGPSRGTRTYFLG